MAEGIIVQDMVGKLAGVCVLGGMVRVAHDA